MKVIDIAFKDMLQAFRSRTALVFMFVVPILITAMFVFLFGGIRGGEEDSLELPTITVQVVNLDTGRERLGEMLVAGLSSGEIPIPMEVSQAQDAEAARRAVDFQEANVAVIVPEDFTAAVMQPDGRAEVEIYQDPTLTLAPSIVSAIVNSYVDGFSGTKIAVGVTLDQLSSSGLILDSSEISAIIADYVAASGDSTDSMLAVRSPSGEQDSSPIADSIQMVMAGMTIFYAFFTGANMVNNILREEEEGTLARLFTTPTRQRSILYGKFLAAFLTVFIQVLVLLIFGRLVFQFDWGSPIRVLGASAGIAVTSSAFGAFIISLLKNPRQTGIAMGAGLTVTGMLGMVKVFTVGNPNTPATLLNLSFLVPQGWALNALTTSMERGSIGAYLTTQSALLAWSVVFLMIGSYRFNRRFA